MVANIGIQFRFEIRMFVKTIIRIIKRKLLNNSLKRKSSFENLKL